MSGSGTPPVLGVIGGSGIYDIAGLENTAWRRVESPFGEPSGELLFGTLDGQQLVFLPHHGRRRPHPLAVPQRQGGGRFQQNTRRHRIFHS